VSTEAKYAAVLAQVRSEVAAEERPYEVWHVSNLVTAALGINFEHKGGYSREIERAQTRIQNQVRRALDALAADGTLVKGVLGKRVEYLPPTLHAQRQAERDRHYNERLGRDARSAAQRTRLAALGIGAQLQFGEVRLTPDQLDILMDLAAKGLS
jgi:hypothetical protein